MMAIKIRATNARDVDAVMAFYPQAFPGEGLRQVVAALLKLRGDILSLGAFEADALLGHVIFSHGTIDAAPGAALLGPLGVAPSHQSQGIGGALIRSGHELMTDAGARQVFVLGDPGYYGQFGFAQESAVRPPCPIPEAWAPAWQSLALGPVPSFGPGQLTLPAPWLDPALWSP